jgi:nitrile hydratase accessory protein
MEREARAYIAEMPNGEALPRKSGELVFHDEWERRSFAIAVALAEAGLYDWSDFKRELIASVGEAELDDMGHPSRDYYESWLIALETLLMERGFL